MATADRITGEQVVGNFLKLVSDRAVLSGKLERCREFACPDKTMDFALHRVNTQETVPERPAKILRNYFAQQNMTLARGLYSNLFPSGVRWLGFSVAGKNVPESVKDFFLRSSQRFYDLLYAESNFPTEIAELLEDAACCGTYCLSVERDLETGFRFENHDISRFFAEGSSRKKRDMVYREYEMTSLQIVNEFSEPGDTVPELIRSEGEDPSNSRNGRIRSVIHYVAPNRERERDKAGNAVPGSRNLPYLSIWVEKDTKAVLRRGGYTHHPYVVGRLDNAIGMIYGSSPMLRCLRTAELSNTILTGLVDVVNLCADPPVAVDMSAYSGLIPQFFRNPGATNVYDSKGNRFNPPTFYTPPNNIPMAMELLKSLEAEASAFYSADLFNMISQLNVEQGRQRTAYEIAQLVAEKNNLILPVVARFLDECVSPVMRTAFLLALESGFFGVVPEALRDLGELDLKIQYFSPLALAAQRNRINGTMSSLEMLAPMAQYDPGVMDLFDFDKLARDTAEAYGAYPEHLRETRKIEAVRKERNAEQRRMQSLNAMTDVAKSQDLTAPVADSSLAAQLAGGVQ